MSTREAYMIENKHEMEKKAEPNFLNSAVGGNFPLLKEIYIFHIACARINTLAKNLNTL